MVVSSWAPPQKGASPHFFYNLFKEINPSSYCIYANKRKIQAKLGTETLEGTYYYYARHIATGSHWLRPLRACVESIHAIVYGMLLVRKEKVQLLLGLSDDGAGLILTALLAWLTWRPYAYYMFDPYDGNAFPPLRSLCARLLEPLLFRHAALVISTSAGLTDIYAKKYPRLRVETVYNGFTEGTRKEAPRMDGHTRTILYSGNIYWAQERSIRNFAEALSTLERDVVFKIFVPHKTERIQALFGALKNVEVGSTSNEEIINMQQTADILFLPLAWSDQGRVVIETAIPGKTTEYLIAGRPILVHAPPYAHLSTYARKEGFAHVVDTEDIGPLREGITRLLDDATYADTLVKNARAVFAKNHDAPTNARRFTALLGTV